MKSYKVFSLLSLSLVLTACPDNVPPFSIGEPTFAKMGQQITMEQFYDGVFAGLNALELNNYRDDVAMSSKRVHAVEAYDEQSDGKVLDKKIKIRRTFLQENNDTFDAETKVASLSSSLKSYIDGKNPDGSNIHVNRNENETYYIQKVRIANEDYLANVYPDKQLIEAISSGLIDETHTEELYFSKASYIEMIRKTNFVGLKAYVQEIYSLTEDELANYKFYKNENTYTYTKQSSVSGVNAIKTFESHLSENRKVQFTFTDYGFDYVFSNYTENKTKYLKDNENSFKKGDYTNYVYRGYTEFKYEDSPSDVHVEAIDYTDFDANVTVLY